jgi:hypothetical protein
MLLQHTEAKIRGELDLGEDAAVRADHTEVVLARDYSADCQG